MVAAADQDPGAAEAGDGPGPKAAKADAPEASGEGAMRGWSLEDWTFDPDDPNYKHQDMLHAVYRAYSKLPEGWKRNPNEKGPTWIHQDGRTSWRNPSRQEIARVLAEMEKENPKAWERPNADSERKAKIKKLRRMIKVGTPLHAVENQARLDGIDPEELTSSGGGAPGEGGGADPKAWERPNADSERKAKIKKLRRMIKVGTPLDAVENQARLDGIDPEELTSSDGGAPGEGGGADPAAKGGADERELRRLRGMLDAGVPLGAVESQARMKGVDPSLLRPGGAAPDEPKGAGAAPDEPKGASAAPALFRVVEVDGGRAVEFASGAAPIAALVRRTVQALRGRGARPGSSLTVDLRDLLNALGSLRAVRRARDAYNDAAAAAATAGSSGAPPSAAEVRARRRPFLEHLSAAGARPPASRRERADMEGLDDLIALVEAECAGEIEARRAKVEAGSYDFDSLSELFEPGTRVVAKNAFASGVDMMCEVSWSKYEEGKTLFGRSRYFRVCFQFVAAVGRHFTVAEFVEGMENFEGTRVAKSLPFVPLAAYDEREAERMLERFRARGEMYGRCAAGSNFLAYSKGSFYAKKGGRRGGGGLDSHAAALRMSGRVMVDTQGSYEAGHSVSVGYDPMVDSIKMKYKEYMLHMRQQKQQASSGGDGRASSSVPSDEGMVLFESIPDDYLTMTWPAAVGFSFTSKAWGDVLVDGLSDIEFRESTFDCLVLPPSRKRMIRALVRHSADAFSDIVAGKGEGSVFLLYGPPGVGKTLTAEAISEMLHRPLYTVSLGQLGTHPAELEAKLGEILDLCGRWDALILLDEADIFLEKRSAAGGSLERNAMVSVMLRLVEYFRGVLFLTSNRVDALDPAFKTRITLALRYDELDREARAEVWGNLLRASGRGDAVEAGRIDPAALAEHELNGREIKNAIRLAMSLAAEDGEPLGQKYISETVEILKDFNAKLENAELY